MVNTKNLAPHKEGNAPDVLPCPACNAKALQGWGILGAVVYCGNDKCGIMLGPALNSLDQWALGDLWNSLERKKNETGDNEIGNNANCENQPSGSDAPRVSSD